MWLIGAMVCLLAVPWVELSVSAGNRWPHNALRHHWLMLINCHFRDCKALLVTSLTHVSGTIASVQTFTFLPFTNPHSRPYPTHEMGSFMTAALSNGRLSPNTMQHSVQCLMSEGFDCHSVSISQNNAVV